jgi:signal transduction histidine kinase/ligand-binding sensor domain-containing protein
VVTRHSKPIQSNRGRELLARVGLAWGFLWLATIPLRSAPHYIIRAWYAEDGLPQNAVTAVLQTSDGYLWLGTYTGLVRFDGARFVVFDDNNTPALKNSRITSLYQSTDGTLWIGHETGDLTRFKAGHFEAVPIKAPWNGGKISGIGADEVGDIWLLNSDGLLARVRDGKLLTPEVGIVEGIVTITQNRQGHIWVSRNGMVSELRHGELHALQFELPRTNCFAFGICASRDGGLWVEADSRIRKWDGKGWAEDRGTALWGSAPLVSFAELRSGWLAAGTTDYGLFLIPPEGEPLAINRTNGLSHNWVRCLWEDREGDLWAGTGTGLNMLRRSNWSTISPPDEWQGCAVLSVTAGHDGSVWIGTEGAGVYGWREGVWSHFDAQNAGLHNTFVWSVAEDAQGRLWAGTWGGGVYFRRHERFEAAPHLEHFVVPATAILPARSGGLWIGTGEGLLRYETNRMTNVGREAGIASPDVRAVVEAADGTVWFGMYGGGLGRLQDGQVRQFHKRDGLGSDFVQCLKLETNGTLWIGTFGGGLSRLKDGLLANISREQGLPNSVICHIEDDGLDNFWMSSYGGIFRVAKAELEACADGNLSKVHCLLYGEGDGLPTLECSGGLQPAGCRPSDGRLWFPTSKGLVVVDPANVTTNLLPPTVVIEEFRVDGHLITNTGPGVLQIEPGHQRFDFRYTALSFVSPERVRFRCHLEGVEKDWVDAGKRREVNYTFVAPGDYVFHVTACNNDEIWNEQGVSFAFTVLPFFWQTGWFRAVTIVALLIAAGGLGWFETRRRMRRELEKLEQQRAIENERSRIAKDIHDDLGSTLTHITMLSDPQRDAKEVVPSSPDNLHQIHTIARELTQSMDEIVWAINPQHDTLDSLMAYLEMFAQDFLETAGLRCRLDVPLKFPVLPLTADARHNLFLAFKEALHNVVKHSGATEVRITATLSTTVFILALQDNGSGFTLSETQGARAAESERSGFGNGLANMRRRLKNIDGHCCIESAPGKGTKVTFVVHLPLASASKLRES